MKIESEFINGYKIYAFLSKAEFLDHIQNEKKILIALNAEKLTIKNKKLNVLINNNIGYPDGIGAVLALRRKGIKAVKIPGTEFWVDIISNYYKTKSFYFIGASQDVIESTISKLKIEFPGIRIKGYRNGFLNKDDKNHLLNDLIAKKPDVVFVAMGSPKQEFLMKEFQHHHSALYMGLGGSFDVYSGLKKRAPQFYRYYGLEWFYRLIKEPARVYRQLTLIKFFFRIIFERI